MATKKTQYDDPQVNWKEEGDQEHHTRQLLRENLLPVLQEVRREFGFKRTLDVGCGQGWLCRLMLDLGAETVIGIDPSTKNADAAEGKVPGATIGKIALDEMARAHQYAGYFDLITAVMVFEHLPSAQEGFMQLRQLLKPKGAIVMVYGDFDVMLSSRRGTVKVTQAKELQPGEVPIETDYGKDRLGILRDIARHRKVMYESAKAAGLHVRYYNPVTIAPWVVKVDPSYKDEVGKAYYHLMVLTQHA